MVTHADPSRTRLRTNEAAFADTWELREARLREEPGGVRHLATALLPTTPRDGLDRSAGLRTWLVENEELLTSGQSPDLPTAMQAGAASMTSPYVRWAQGAPISEAARRSFSLGTCSGCHGGERPDDALRFHHIAAWDAPGPYYARDGRTQVSAYLDDPRGGGDDELGRRTRVTEAILCDAPAPTDYVRPSCR